MYLRYIITVITYVYLSIFRYHIKYRQFTVMSKIYFVFKTTSVPLKRDDY